MWKNTKQKKLSEFQRVFFTCMLYYTYANLATCLVNLDFKLEALLS
jgi:hypothetical protein